MGSSAFSRRDKMNMLAIIKEAESAGVTSLHVLRDRLQLELDNEEKQYSQQFRPAQRRSAPRRKTPAILCPICGSPAVMVRLNTGGGNQLPGYSHAIQCQNRPKTDQQWEKNHCGHTEYVAGEIK